MMAKQKTFLQAYRNFRKGRDGRISKEDFVLEVEAMGLGFNQEEICEMFEWLDRDKRGSIDFNNFVVLKAEPM
jgi:Ca2+-binding EF-hand superfamily protein